MRRKLIVLAGPTAVGKTDEAISLAQTLNTEILSSDSRQFYKELKIGVASPKEEDLIKVKHHFIGHISIQDSYSIGHYEKDALEKIDDLFQHKDTLILTGGSGMYIDVLCNGIDILPDVKTGVREMYNKKYKEEGLLALQKELEEKDPIYYEKVDKKNPIRLIRALEVMASHSKPFSSFLTKIKQKRNFDIIKFALYRDRPHLIERINKRVDIMLEEGLEKEARGLYPFKHLQALNSVGYKEMFRYFDNEISYWQAVEDIKTNTRRYAKRQMTWFRRDEKIIWIEANEKKIDWQWQLERIKE